ncbi:MAG: hypothetical protein ACM3ML_09535 [Micromonosporaceae bacterium]
MTQRRWDDDDQLLDDLAEAVRAVARESRTTAKHGRAALYWRTIDEDLELAGLSFDSLLEPADATRTDPGGTRTLVFAAAPMSVELEVSADGVVGQIIPPGAGEIRIESADGDLLEATANELGYFLIPVRPAGQVRLTCETPRSRLVTEWVRL